MGRSEAMGWFEAFVVINVILIALLLAVLMYLHRIYGVLKSIDERDESKMQSKKTNRIVRRLLTRPGNL